MGREIRMVIPNWEHPQQEKFNVRTRKDEMQYKPLYDQSYKDACQEWHEEFKEWMCQRLETHVYGEDEFWDGWRSTPDVEYYRPHWEESEMTWFQLYQTVSEGSPVSPPFETKQELVDYLVENGDFWYQKNPDGWRTKPTREQAESLVDDGFAFSMVMSNNKILDPYQQQDLKEE